MFVHESYCHKPQRHTDSIVLSNHQVFVHCDHARLALGLTCGNKGRTAQLNCISTECGWPGQLLRKRPCLRVGRATSNMEGWRDAVVPAYNVQRLWVSGDKSIKTGDRLSVRLCAERCTIGSSTTGRACPLGSRHDFSSCRLGVWRAFAFA